MRFASLCSGIEAPSVAWAPLTWEAAWFSEIASLPCAVLRHRYPNVPNLGDMTKISEAQIEELGPIDLLVAGLPCQSYSVAGERCGMDDSRGALFWDFLRIARAVRPRWVLVENVPGLLSADGGRALGTVLGELAGLGYGWAYRVLDAQYFGLAQRRERVFVVGHLGDWRRAAAVLLERSCMRGDSPPRREAGKGVAGTFAPGTHPGGVTGQDGANGQPVTHTLRGVGHDASEDGTGRGVPLVAASLGAHKGGGWRGDLDHETFVAHTTGAGTWADGAGTLRGREQESHEHLVVFGGGNSSSALARAPCLTAHGPGRLDFESEAFILHAQGSNAMCGNGTATSAFRTDTARALDATGGFAAGQGGTLVASHAVTFNWQGGGTQTSLGFDPGSDIVGVLGAKQTPAVAFAENSRHELRLEGGNGSRIGALSCGGGLPGQGMPTIAGFGGVRRLMPVEAERLQGFPGHYTFVPTNRTKKRVDPADARYRVVEGQTWRMAADGPRYTAIGNSIAVPVLRWIGRRIEAVEKIT